MENNSEREGEGAKRSRIYVGGLGGNVTEDEIRKTFSGLGEVESVDIFRTKGRSFAYLDFLPSNHKSLPKLFSTYNGCMWKGGRLRLEKAKEHYLLRLRREWAEDAQLASNALIHDADASESMPSLEKPKKLATSDKERLRIFFPKLNTMKSLPFSGTGKHKYSFQRITVPSLPIHFCDCEEHSDSFHVAKEKPSSDLETANGGIREEERNMMESIMNKLFEREKLPEAACSEAKSTEEGDNSVDPVDLLVDENMSDPVSDEDNLIINMVAGGNERILLLGGRGQNTITVNQGPTYGESKTSKDMPARKVHESLRKKIEPYNKKRKSLLAEGSDGNEPGSFNTERKRSLQISSIEKEDQTTQPESHTQQSMSNFSWSQKSAWRDLVGKRGNTPFQISHIVSSIPSAKEEQPGSDDLNVPYSTNVENKNLLKHQNSESQLAQSKDLKGPEAPALPNEVSNKSARGASWLQKSSWTQLVGDTNKSSFSISQVLSGLTFEKQELLKPNGIDAANSRDVEKHNLFKLDKVEPIGDSYKDLKVTNKTRNAAPHSSDVIALSKKEQTPTGPQIEQTTTPEKKQPTVRENNEVTAPTLGKRYPSGPKQTSIGGFGIGETCLFMRSADSMNEWAKAKAALSGSLKKKGDGLQL